MTDHTVDEDAERLILAAALRASDESAWIDIQAALPHALCFANREHRLLYLVLERMAADRMAHDPMLVATRARCMRFQAATDCLSLLQRVEQSSGLDVVRDYAPFRPEWDTEEMDSSVLMEIGGLSWLSRLSGMHVGLAWRSALPRLQGLYRLRCVIAAMERAVPVLKQPDGLDRLPGVVQQLSRVAEASEDTQDVVSRGDELSAYLDDHDRIVKKASWGNAAFNHALKLHTMHYITLAAYPGGFKTALALQAATATADLLDGEPGSVLMFSLEMPRLMLDARWVGSQTEVPWEKILNKDLDAQELVTVRDQLRAWQSRKDIVIRDTSTDYTINGIVRAIAAHKRKYPECRLVIIDHIGLIAPKGQEADYDRISRTARELRLAVNRYEVCIIGLCQFSRDSNKKSDEEREPKLSLLRGSQEIENSSTGIAFLTRTPGDGRTCELTMRVAKNNYGQSGQTATAHVDLKTQTITSPAVHREKPAAWSRAPSDDEDLFHV